MRLCVPVLQCQNCSATAVHAVLLSDVTFAFSKPVGLCASMGKMEIALFVVDTPANQPASKAANQLDSQLRDRRGSDIHNSLALGKRCHGILLCVQGLKYQYFHKLVSHLYERKTNPGMWQKLMNVPEADEYRGSS